MKLTGIVTIKVDGEIMRSKEGAKLSLGGKERTAQTGNKVYGFTEKLVPSMCEFTLAHAGGDDLIGLQNSVDTTLEFETDTGDTYMIRDAFSTKPAELTGGEGDVAMEFSGQPAELL
jgi:hypothetical protein